MIRPATVSAPCGLSIVSSYATGVGAVLTIDQRITIAVRRESAGGSHDFGSGTEARFRAAGAMLASELTGQVAVSFLVDSIVPPSRGLKTSSAVLAATTYALSRLGGANLSHQRIASVASCVARRTGLTRAGGCDDMLAVVFGGAALAVGGTPRLIRTLDVPAGVDILIRIPKHVGPGHQHVDRITLSRPYAPAFRRIVDRIERRGFEFETMSEAAFLQARALGQDTDLLRTAMHFGASAVSLSGKGPTIAALGSAACLKIIAESWKAPDVLLLRTRPEHSGLRVEDVES